MSPTKNYRKPNARREQVSLRLDGETLAFLDACWAPGLSFRSSRAEAAVRIISRTRDFLSFSWGRVRGQLTADDLWCIAGALQGSDPSTSWRWLATAVSDPDIEPEDPRAAAIAEKIASWDAGTRFAVVTMVDRALARAFRAHPEWASMGVYDNSAIHREFEAMLRDGQ